MAELEWNVEDGVDHDQLLRLAECVETAADAGDRAALQERVRRFLSSLAIHLDDEAPRGVLDPALTEAMSHSKHRVVEEFVGIAREAATSPTARCRCAPLAQRALVRLHDQIEAETLPTEPLDRAGSSPLRADEQGGARMTDPESASASAVALDEIIAAQLAGDGVHWSLDAEADLNVNLAHLGPGSRVAAHTNDECDVAVIVLAGSGRLRLDRSDHELAPHVLALAPRGIERSITAEPDGLTYLTVHRRRGPLGIARSGAPTTDTAARPDG